MNIQKPRRNRGIILTSEGWQKFQGARLKSEIQEKSGEKYTFEDLSERTRLTPVTLRKVLAREEGVDKRTIIQLFMAFNLELKKSDYSQPDSDFETLEPTITPKRQDWGDAICVSAFYGRAEELIKLHQWLLNDRCRLVALLGMGGIGKTTLSVKLAQQIQDKFEYVQWLSLRDAPPVKAILGNLIQFLSDEEKAFTSLPESVGDRISLLMDSLRSKRCLLILDNAESILASSIRAGQYREGYEEYGEFLKRVGEVPHQSCLVLTSREKPKEIASLEGKGLPVRSLRLSGLKEREGQEIFKVKGLSSSEDECRMLVERYAGNALALKVVATTIQDLFSGNISEFLQQEASVFGDIRELLDQQFERLSSLEKDIMYWLAINREPMAFSEVRDDIVSPIPPPKLLEALESLGRRSLVEKNASLFTLQPVVMEYVTHRFIDQICAEIATHNIDLFRCHALIKATAKDYVRETQIRLILQRVLNGLLDVLRSKTGIENQLTKILVRLQQESPLELGYTGGNIFNLLCQMGTDLSGYDFSNLTIWQADLRGRTLQNVNFSHADFAKSVFTKTFSSISCVAFSPDGELLATSDTNGEICLWQGFADGEQLFTLTEHTGWVRQVAFSPDGRTLASCSTDKTVKLWDVSTGECLKTLRGHGDRVRTVAFSPDGHTLASGGDDQTLKLWNASSGECLKTLQGHVGCVWAVAFSPQGLTLASGCDNQTVKQWNARTGECLKTLGGHTGCIWSVAFSPDGQTIASSSDDQTVKLWDVSTGECRKTLQGYTDCRVQKVVFSPDGQTIASGSDDKTVKLWDVSTGECHRTLQGHIGAVWSVAFSPDSQTLVSSSNDQTIKLWNVSKGECHRTSQGYRNGVESIALSPQGTILASSGADQTVKLWNTSTNQCHKVLPGHTGYVQAVALSPDGQILASGSKDQTVKLWDVSTGKCCKTLRRHTGCIQTVAFSPDSQTLVSGSEDQTVNLWDVSTGECKRTLKHNNGVWSVAFSPDGKTLASGSEDEMVKLWDVSTGECLKTLRGHGDRVRTVAFSPQGKIIASGSKDQTVKLWDVSTAQCCATLEGHTSWVCSVAFSPDGQTLASGGIDKTVRLWSISTGRCLKTLLGHTHWVGSVAFSSDGQTFASSSEDETIKLWDVSTGECRTTLKSSKPYEGMNMIGATGLSEATIASVKVLGAIDDQEDIFVS